MVGAKFSYSSFALHKPGVPPRRQSSAQRCAEPSASSSTVEFLQPSLGIQARYKAIDPAFERSLLECSKGCLHWSVVAPRAEALVKIGDTTLVGLGYAESIRMTIPPWHLPIDTLHWGRALSGRGSAVWLRWEGAHPLGLVAIDGVLEPAHNIDSQMIEWSGGSLRLAIDSVLRDAPIGPQIVRSVPAIGRIAPLAFLGAMETKWLSKAHPDGDASNPEIWAVHERVRFGPRQSSS